jgi:hypothetical protein
MLVMNQKRPKKKGVGRPPGRKPTVAIQARVSPELGAALDALTEQTRRTKNVELVLALESHLKAAGLWPPESEEDE